MKKSIQQAALVLALAAALPGVALAGKSTPDVLPPVRRQATVRLAEEYSKNTPPPKFSEEFPSPFDPAGFDKPDPAEVAASAAANNRGPATPGTGGPAAPVKVIQSDRSVLETVAARIPVTGMITDRSGKQILTGKDGKKFYVGNIITVTDGSQDYELEIVSIDRTTFTLRYRGEEITRNIRLK